MNKPKPLREFDQIAMKAGDMVMQAEFVAAWSDGQRLVFIGDGDSIGVCVAYLRAMDILSHGPVEIKVLDFDEREVRAVNTFAQQKVIFGVSAQLYKCIDQLPVVSEFDCFYTNPPWGASDGGASVMCSCSGGWRPFDFRGSG